MRLVNKMLDMASLQRRSVWSSVTPVGRPGGGWQVSYRAASLFRFSQSEGEPLRRDALQGFGS
jgi:hypothetical protein